MPTQACLLVALFAVVAVALGVLGWWIARAVGGPRRARWAIVPGVAAFVALYLVGHRSGVSSSPVATGIPDRLQSLYEPG